MRLNNIFEFLCLFRVSNKIKENRFCVFAPGFTC